MRNIFYLLFLLFAFSSCNEFTKIQKSDNHDYKAEKAHEYFEIKKYDKAVALYESVIPYIRLSTDFERIYYRYAYCHYYLRDYYLANYYFKSFAKQFPQSNFSEDALFMAALCSVKNSPNYQLDQSETQGAIDELQLFMNRYPTSVKKDTCNKIIDGLVIKLEKKAFENAYLYYKTENYKSAMIAFKGVLEEFPATSQKNELMLLIVKAGYKYSVMSIDSKKQERYNETLKNYNNFASLFTDPAKKEEAESFSKNCLKDLENLKSTLKK
jgi:outer membrane protein assembly factor BamD